MPNAHFYYSAYHGFGQAKIPNGGLILGSSQFSLLPQLPQKMMLTSKVVKSDPKAIVSFLLPSLSHKSVIHPVIAHANEKEEEVSEVERSQK